MAVRERTGEPGPPHLDVRLDGVLHDVSAPSLVPYLSAFHASWLRDEPDRVARAIDGTLVFADVSGFTPLAERLARKGKVGAEELTDTLNSVFRELLDVARGFGGDCLKFGGDALLLLFVGDEHAPRAAAAADAMLGALRFLRRHGSGAGLAKLNMSIGVHSGIIDAFLVGSSHRELLLTGPVVSGVLALESIAEAGQVLVSEATAAELAPGDVEETRSGLLLRRGPTIGATRTVIDLTASAETADGVPAMLRAHLDGRHKEGEHRLAAIAFVKFGGTDQLLLERGGDALSEALDELVEATQTSCAAHGVTFLGTDVDRDGGKLLLATGTPTASADDEDRLLLAVRSVLDTVGSLPLRAGVNRGRVFSVDLGSSARRTFTVMGDAVNLAARVMAKAEWGELLATTEVLERCRTDFDVTAVPPFAVKGKSDLVHARLVGGVLGRRDEAPELATQLVGRDPELAVIRDALAGAHAGIGQIVELVGEPGIGKSKLVSVVTALDHGLTRFTFEAGRYSLATPYFALRRGMRNAMDLAPDAPDGDVEAALRAVVELTAPELEDRIPLLGIPLGLNLPDTPETARLDPANRQASLQNAVVALMRKVLDGPTLITIEDSHWLDTASCELLRSLLVDVDRRPWAVLVTRRDETGGLALQESDAVTSLRLQPLDGGAAAALASASVAGASLPPGVIEMLVERSGGNPLFLQELVNAALRGGSMDELPDTVEAVVATTIDTLAPDDRSLLRHAAVLGNHFPLALLATMLRAPGNRVAIDVRRLGHFLQSDRNGMLRFRHVLLRDVAYEGLSFRARRNLHQRAGTILEESSKDPEAMAELLSIHFHRAGRYRDSWRYSSVAGARARHNGAPIEAAAFYTCAIEAGRRLHDIGDLARSDVVEELGDTWELAGRYEPAADAYRDARRLARGDHRRQGRLSRKIGYIRDHDGSYTQAERWFRRGLRELEADPSADDLRASILVASGSSKLRQGRISEAVALLRDAVTLAEACDDKRSLAHAYCQLDRAFNEQGRPDEAVLSAGALALYEELGDERGKAASYNQMGLAAYQRGEWDDAVDLYGKAGEADTRAGALADVAISLNNIGEVRSDQGRLDEAEALLREAHLLWSGAGWRIAVAYATSNLGRAMARSGRLDEAAEHLAFARDEFVALGAESMLLESEAKDVERLVFARQPDAAIERVAELVSRAAKLDLPNVVSMLDRLAGTAFCQLGQPARGVPLLERSVIDCRDRRAYFDAALGLEALAQVGGPLGRPGTDVLAAEASATFARLGVVSLAAVAPVNRD